MKSIIPRNDSVSSFDQYYDFLHITGRLSQFSKIGGEMVPHLSVESAILQVVGCNEQTVSVTSSPDEVKGERLVVLHTKLTMKPAEIVAKPKRENRLPFLWIPEARNFAEIDELPVLTTGKLDLCQIRNIAINHTIS